MIQKIKELYQRGKEWVLEQVLWAERYMKGKPGAEKKAAVVKKLDDMITLPVYLEWLDDMVLPWLVDMACNMLNDMYGHRWPETGWNEEHITEAAAIMPDPETGGDGQNAGAEEN